MPAQHEQRTVNGETREWTGARWEPVANPVSRFASGAMETSPLNPVNLIHALLHPVDTATSMVAGPVRNAVSAAGDLRDVVTGGENNDRLLAGANLAQHALGAVPLIGEPLRHAGERMGQGDVAGGAGEFAGIASGALLPEMPGAVGYATRKVGQGAEWAGKGMQAPMRGMAGFGIPALGIAEAIARMDPRGIVAAGAPLGLEYGGKGMQKLGGALEGLQGKIDNYRGETTGGRFNRVLQSGGDQPVPHDTVNASARTKYEATKASEKRGASTAAKASGVDPSFRDPTPELRPSWHGGGTPAEDSWPGMGPNVDGAPPESISTIAPPAAPAYNGPIGRLTGQKSPTVNSALEDALNGLREQPSVREGTPDASWGPGGTKGWTGSRYEPAPNPNLRPPIDPEAQALRDQTAPHPGSPAAADGVAARLLEMEHNSLEPAQALQELLGTPTEAELASQLGTRNATGKWGELADRTKAINPPWWSK